jgi:hypothetical protein
MVPYVKAFPANDKQSKAESYDNKMSSILADKSASHVDKLVQYSQNFKKLNTLNLFGPSKEDQILDTNRETLNAVAKLVKFLIPEKKENDTAAATTQEQSSINDNNDIIASKIRPAVVTTQTRQIQPYQTISNDEEEEDVEENTNQVAIIDPNNKVEIPENDKTKIQNHVDNLLKLPEFQVKMDKLVELAKGHKNADPGIIKKLYENYNIST